VRPARPASATSKAGEGHAAERDEQDERSEEDEDRPQREEDRERAIADGQAGGDRCGRGAVEPCAVQPQQRPQDGRQSGKRYDSHAEVRGGQGFGPHLPSGPEGEAERGQGRRHPYCRGEDGPGRAAPLPEFHR